MPIPIDAIMGCIERVRGKIQRTPRMTAHPHPHPTKSNNNPAMVRGNTRRKQRDKPALRAATIQEILTASLNILHGATLYVHVYV